MIQNQPPNQAGRLKSIVCVNIHIEKIHISRKHRLVRQLTMQLGKRELPVHLCWEQTTIMYPTSKGMPILI